MAIVRRIALFLWASSGHDRKKGGSERKGESSRFGFSRDARVYLLSRGKLFTTRALSNSDFLHLFISSWIRTPAL